MRRRFRAFVVVVAAVLAGWGGWWWVQHTYVGTSGRPVAHALEPAVAASPQVCMEPDGTIVNNCAEKLASGQVVMVADGSMVTMPQPVTMAQQDAVVAQPAVAAEDVEAAAEAVSGPCITPPGDIYAPDCAAPPAPQPAGGGGGGGGGGAPNPCITPPGAIYAPDCAATPAPK